MASRSTRRRKSRRAEALDEEGGVGAFLIRHRAAVGSLTAFAVAFSYVGANAIWYQPHAHGGAFFETRPAAASPAAAPGEGAQAGPETVIRLERPLQEQPAAAQPAETEAAAALEAAKGDPVVETVQRVLADLNLYQGEIDGLSGPQTRSAVEAYRKMIGMEMEAGIDGQLLTQLGVAAQPATPSPPETDMMATASAVAGDARIMRIQAGLKAFGNDGIDIDGVVGARTRAAIREFQSLFGLPETGEPDEAVYVKMREIGLTD